MSVCTIYLATFLIFLRQADAKVTHLNQLKFSFDGNIELSKTSTHSKIVMCLTDPYFMSTNDLSVEDIPIDLCTHVLVETRFINNTLMNFKDLNVSAASQVRGFNNRITQLQNSINSSCQFVLSINSYKGDTGIKLLESIGGTKQNHLSLIEEALDIVRENRYNGVNIELYPSYRFQKIGEKRLTEFVQLLSEELKKLNSSLMLTFHSPFTSMVDKFDWNHLDNFLDFIIFRHHIGWDYPIYKGTAPNVALKGIQNSVDQYVKFSRSANLSGEKIIIGYPTYSLEYKLISRYSVPQLGGPFTKISNQHINYPTICESALLNEENWKFYYDDVTESTFMTAQGKLTSFCSPLQISRLGKYVMQENLGGIAIWGLMTEDKTGYYCDIKNTSSYPLIRTLNLIFSHGLEELTYSGIFSVKNIAWILVALVIFLLAISVFYATFRNFVKKSKDILTKTEEEEFYKGSESLLSSELKEFYQGVDDNPLSCLIRYDGSLEIPKSEFSIDKNSILGCGEFGTVYKGQLRNDTVAVKTTKMSSLTKEGVKSFLDEIRIMAYIGRHANVLALIGANTSKIRKGKIFAFVDFCEYGSLQKTLQSSRDSFHDLLNVNPSKIKLGPEVRKMDGTEDNFDDNPICSKDLLLWALQISKGMEFLSEKKVIHGDLATRNTLVYRRDCIKISDFGLSRKLYNYGVYKKTTQEPLPWRWMAIESLRDLEFSQKSDMWAYGVTLWEIFSLAKTPYQEILWSPNFVNLLLDGLRLQKPTFSTQDIYKMMEKCWEISTTQRPEFKQMSEWFEDLFLSV